MDYMSAAPRPRTKFRTGDGSDELVTSYPVGVLLLENGFWGYLRENVSVSDPAIFDGPYEGGQLAPEQLGPFISAVRHWIRQYDGTEDTVYSRAPKGGASAEAMPEEITWLLRRIEAMAIYCQAESIPLGFST